MTFPTWMMLDLCAGYLPGDGEVTMSLCQSQFESKMRGIDDPRINLGFGLKKENGDD